jgi:hypothetical protein
MGHRHAVPILSKRAKELRLMTGLKKSLLTSVAALSCAFALSACGSPTALQSACNKVSAVLSDGPSPKADPIGYAESQMGPLLLVNAPTKALRSALQDLSAAYVQFFTTNGDAASKRLLSRADEQLGDVCPGVAS